MRLYDFYESGNGFKVRLLLAQLGIPHERVELDAMEAHLAGHDYFVGGCYSIADIALYAYTHVAEEGNYDLSSRPAILAWLARVAGQPGSVKISDVEPHA